MYDVIIIGAGVIGCAVARELTGYQLHIAVLEREEDVCCGTSKANSGLVHAGFDAKPGTLKAAMNVQGTAMMPRVCQELDVPYRRTGALVVATCEKEKEVLDRLLRQGVENGVEELRILDAVECHRMEPNLPPEVTNALYAPTAGIICPFALTIAMAENANVNGAEFFFETEVRDVRKDMEKDCFVISTVTADGEEIQYESRCIVNCAGVYSDRIHNMLCARKYHITPRRGEYCLLDRTAGAHVGRTIFRVPGPLGKGILVTPTVHGNLLLGPTAEDIENREGVNTTSEGLAKILGSVGQTVMNIPTRETITSYAGLRAHEDGGDFILQEAEDCPGLVDAVGIESPGLSGAPAIGKRLADIVAGILKPEKNGNYTPYRRGIVHFLDLPEKEQRKLLKVRPEYGTIVCRCESVTEGEILDAIYRPLGAKSLDGIKRRTRAGMGRCQSGFCSPKVSKILADSLQVPRESVTKAGPGTEILKGGQS